MPIADVLLSRKKHLNDCWLKTHSPNGEKEVEIIIKWKGYYDGHKRNQVVTLLVLHYCLLGLVDVVFL